MGGAQAAARETVRCGPDSDDNRRTLETAPPAGCAPSPVSAGEEDDDATVVATRPAIRPPRPDAGSGEGSAGRPDDQPEGRAP